MALMFKEAEKGKIAGGHLRAFLRSWPGDMPRLPIGSEQLAYTRPHSKPFAKLRIRRAIRTTTDGLTPAQAAALGCRSVELARNKVKAWKPGLIGEGRQPLWVVEFDVVEVL